MERIGRIIAALVATLALAACFYGPGAFTSTLDLRKDGSFAFAYKGEIIFLNPDTMGGLKPANEIWKDDMASCTKADDSSEPRPCSRAEVAEQRKAWQAERATAAEKNRKEAEQFGAMFGYTPGNDDANRKLAASMMRYDGWKSVVYKGNGVFDVDYRMAGKLDHDFVFPIMPQSNMILPFVMTRKQAPDSARVSAPALVASFGNLFAEKMQGLGGATGGPTMASSRTKGSFTLTTDGVIRTNNTEDGPADIVGGHKLVWQIGPDSKTPPEALIQLK
ncbi:hypothetical protein [Sphingobium subterraneum]|uniref:Lipoprotein n=1 Tax=Sphingobium subterraneum TaxID=627688 RepID=A0A841IYT3_9SPHN|nr:hypothetical protein [Sphingobium subterraneum]MBB6123292.1 hypothetical protein [Sphingobium subterraneum]